MTSKSESQKINELPLSAMDYTGSVEGTQANLELKLSYDNKLSRPLEPIFTFPLPAEASVLGVTVKVGDRTIQSELKRADDAKKDYQQAVDAGHHASLLEQNRDNIFTMSVGGIEPGEKVEVSVKYTHPVDWQNSGGRFVVPLVVAPHFIHGNPIDRKQGLGFSPDTDAVPDASKITPHVAANPDDITYRASVHVKLDPGFAARVASPSHDALLLEQDLRQGDQYTIDLKDLRPDRDFTVTYQSTERGIQVKADKTVWNPEGKIKEEFAVIQVTPGAQTELRRREVVLCLDVSGSMQGLPIEGLRAVARKVVDQLKQSAEPVELGIIAFSNTPEVLLPLQRLTADNAGKIEEVLKQLEAGGGTHATSALNTSLSMFRREQERFTERSVVFVTDGDTSDCSVDKLQLNGARVHAVGLSTAVDHAVLKDLARVSGGSTYWVYPGENYDTAAREITSRTAGPVVRNLKIEGAPQGSEIVGSKELYASQPGLIAVRSTGALDGLTVVGEGSDGKKISFPITGLSQNQTISYGHSLWTKIRLRDEVDQAKATDLSLKYGVLSRGTSFVAVLLKDRPGQKPERVEIPVSLPHGWEMEQGWAAGHQGYALAAAATSGGGVRFRSAGGPRFNYCAGSGGMVMKSAAPMLSEALPVTQNEPQLLQDTRTFLAGLKGNRIDEVAAGSMWNQIVSGLKALTTSNFPGWSDSDRSELFRCMAELRGYGYKTELPKELQQRPNDSRAMQVWRQALRLIGIEQRV